MKQYITEAKRLQKLAGINEAFVNIPGEDFDIGDTVYNKVDKRTGKVIGKAHNWNSIKNKWEQHIRPATDPYDLINPWYEVDINLDNIVGSIIVWFPKSELSFTPLDEAFINDPGSKFVTGDKVYDIYWVYYGDEPEVLEIIDIVLGASSIPKSDSLDGRDLDDHEPEEINGYWYKVKEPSGNTSWHPEIELTFDPNENNLNNK